MTEFSNEYWEKKFVGKTLVQNDETTTLEADKIVRMNEVPEIHRILPPGKPMTRDYRPERLNVFIDKDNKIERVYYG